MKIICAWCKKFLGYKCPHCGNPLTLLEIGRHHWAVCKTDPYQAHFDPDHMNITHSMCEQCEIKLLEIHAEESDRRAREKECQNISPETPNPSRSGVTSAGQSPSTPYRTEKSADAKTTTHLVDRPSHTKPASKPSPTPAQSAPTTRERRKSSEGTSQPSTAPETGGRDD